MRNKELNLILNLELKNNLNSDLISTLSIITLNGSELYIKEISSKINSEFNKNTSFIQLDNELNNALNRHYEK